MQAAPFKLSDDTTRVVYTIAKGHLSSALDALARLKKQPRENEADPEALHDFRVALRKLAATFKAYQLAFDPRDDADKLRKKVRKLASATNTTRDLEVQLHWFEKHWPTLLEATPEKKHASLTLLRSHLQDRVQREYRQLETELLESASIAKWLSNNLASCLTDVTNKKGAIPPQPFSVFFLGRVKQQSHQLAQRLAKIEGIDDESLCHKARIATKNVRYLLEPVADQLPHSKHYIKTLKSLQTQLGDFNDLNVLLLQLDKLIKQHNIGDGKQLKALVVKDRKKAFKRFRKNWPGGVERDFENQIIHWLTNELKSH